MPKLGKKTREKRVYSVNENYCRKCMKYRSPTQFYETTNPMLDSNGLMSICKDCCNDIYNHYFGIYGTMEIALDLTCQDLDVRFSQESLKQCQSHVEKLLGQGKPANAVFGYYKSKLATTGKNNESIDVFRYKDSSSAKLKTHLSSEENTLEPNIEVYEIDMNTKKFWGGILENWEYEYLNDELHRIQSSFECPDYGMEMLMRDICFMNLGIEKIRRGIDKGDIGKLMETRGKLMNDAKMKPIQSTGAEANEQVTFGTLIKKWETEKPVPVALDDDMKKYIDTYMVGHLAKMQGLNCDLVDKYEESLKEYTIDFNEIDDEDDE